MAPVGSPECLAAALRAGADSIYFGIEHLNMRAHSASAFTINDLRRIARECRACGVKSYLTVNTIIYDNDIALMRQILDAARQAERYSTRCPASGNTVDDEGAHIKRKGLRLYR